MLTQRRTTSTLMLLALLLGLTLTAHPAYAQQTFTVTATDDASDALTGDGLCDTNQGSCTLRAAIEEANATAGLDTITFNISGTGPHTIEPSSALPAITDPVIIDGLSQPGASCASWPPTLLVELTGTGADGDSDGLTLLSGASGSTLRGLVINRFQDNGIVLHDSDNNTIACNFIGTDVSGTTTFEDGTLGILVTTNADNNTIGGLTASARNLISGNGTHGIKIELSSTGNQVLGNFIGTDVTGVAPLGNGDDGIQIEDGATGNTVGGTTSGARNIISGNGSDGVVIDDEAFGNVVLGNFIGTDATGTADLGNGDHGVVIDEGGHHNTIGGTAPGAGNVISGNDHIGILLDGSRGSKRVRANIVQGNLIGLNAAGDAALPNDSVGVFIAESPSNLIGGTEPGARNVISGNGADVFESGIIIGEADSTIIQGNFIGTDITGTYAIPNFDNGIYVIFSNHILVGGTDAGAGNLISGNGEDGVFILFSLGSTLQGNTIGTDVSGTTALGNGAEGVTVGLATNTLIGGTTPGAGNLLSGNGKDGILITASTNNTVIQGNRIGTAANGSDALGNGRHGINFLSNSRDNMIGGASGGAGNTIAFNDSVGVLVQSDGSVRNALLGNTIFNNGELGIDLTEPGMGRMSDGVTANDPGDADTGPNQLQNYPLVAEARLTLTGELFVTYSVDSDPANAAYPLRVEFFQSDTDNQEGQRFLGFDTYTAADFAAGSKTISLGQATATSVLATATDDSGNTSEFGAAQGVTIDPAADLEVQAKIERTQGAEVTLSFAVLNHGHAAGKATVELTLPSDLLFVSASGDGSYDAQSGKWKTGKVKVGKTAALEITVRRLSADAQTVTATITKASVPDLNQANNSASITLEAVQARLGEEAESLAVQEALPTEFVLSSNYPNPFNPATTIPFALPEASPVSIVVYDVTGRRVAVLAEGPMAAGRHEVSFRADSLPSGVYLVRMQAGSFSQVRRMTLVK